MPIEIIEGGKSVAPKLTTTELPNGRFGVDYQGAIVFRVGIGGSIICLSPTLINSIEYKPGVEGHTLVRILPPGTKIILTMK